MIRKRCARKSRSGQEETEAGGKKQKQAGRNRSRWEETEAGGKKLKQQEENQGTN
jgi:hypothetical protein